MSHYDKHYENYYDDLVGQANISVGKKKADFINKNMKELGVSYQEALFNYEQDIKNHAKILNSW